MLKILRNKKTAKKVWIGLAIIIIPAFALWGFGGGFRSRQETAPAGKIFGRNISYTEFRDAIAAEKIMAIMRFGDKLGEVQQYLNLEAQAWERLILLAEAKKRRITASDQEVIEDIENSSVFQFRGAFNNKIYNEILRYSLRVQPRIFEELTRQNLILSKLHKQVTDKVSLSDEQIKNEYAKANQELSIYYVASLVSDFAKNISPTGKEIEAAKKSAGEKIKECLSQLATEELLAAGRKLGLKTGSTGLFKYGAFIDGLGPAQVFWDASDGLKENQPSQIISVQAGFYIIKIKSRTPVDEARFAKEKADFAIKILFEKKQNYFNTFVEELNKRSR